MWANRSARAPSQRPALDGTSSIQYITSWLSIRRRTARQFPYESSDRPPFRHSLSPRRSHAPGDPIAPGHGLGDGQGIGGAIPDERARGIQAPPGPRAGRADKEGPAGALAASHTRSRAHPRGRRVGRRVQALLGREPRQTRQLPPTTSERRPLK